LPSPYGIGDFGSGAYQFVDFLKSSKQSYWQILPLNPTDIALANSPYSSCSAFAGNVLLISPEFLIRDGFLTQNNLKEIDFSEERVDYLAVAVHKVDVLYKVFYNVKSKISFDEKFKDFYGEDSAEYKRIATDYRLLMHGETAAEESKNILTDEFLIEHGIEKDAEKIRGIVSNAIAEHMGPNPGYMGFILEITNNKLREMEESEIEHPKARGTVSEILLAADMKSLASRCGIEKVISIRCNFNKTQDQKTVTDYNEKGIDLTIGEAALISALSSAFQARNMIEDSKLQTLINEVINEAIKGDYEYGLEGEKEIVNCKDTIEKQKKYLSIIAQEKETE